MKKVMICILCILVLFVFTACGDSSDTVSSVSTSDEAIDVVKNYFNSDDQYTYELSHEDVVIKEKGGYYTNRDNDSSVKGIDCFIIRVFTESQEGDTFSQDNFGWYFVSKSTGKIYELKDPYEQKL